MTNKTQEQCSCLIDGELDESECCGILDKISNNEELRQDLHRYYLIRDVLQTNLPSVINTKFSQSVMDAIESEPTILAPTSTSDFSKDTAISSSTHKENTISRLHFSKRVASFAIAASVATIAVFTFNTTNNVEQTTDQIAQMPDSSEFIRLSKSNSTVPKTIGVAPSEQKQLSDNMLVSQPLRSTPMPAKSTVNIPNKQIHSSQQIQKYIINHNHHISSSRLQSIMPYARIVVTKTNNQESVQQ